MDKYRKEWDGKLKGKIVLLTDAKQPKPDTKARFERYTDAQLAEIAQAPEPSIKRHITNLNELQFPKIRKKLVSTSKRCRTGRGI